MSTASDRIAVLRRGELVANKKAIDSSLKKVTALITVAIEKFNIYLPTSNIFH